MALVATAPVSGDTSTAPDFGESCTSATPGPILVPTPTFNPPFVRTPSLDGIDQYWVQSIVEGTRYWLWSAAGTAVIGGVAWPDFNVAFLDADDDQIGSPHTTVGDQSSLVPLGAAYALVYMFTGPDADTDDESIQTLFIFGQGCAGKSVA